MEELLQCDVSSTSYLFNKEGLITKPQKSVLVQDLDDATAPANDSELQPTCIAAVMANIRKKKHIYTDIWPFLRTVPGLYLCQWSGARQAGFSVSFLC